MFSRFSANGVQSGSLLAPQFPVSNHFGLANLGFALCLDFTKTERGREDFTHKYVVVSICMIEIKAIMICSVFVRFYSDFWPLPLVPLKKLSLNTALGEAEHGIRPRRLPLADCSADSLILLAKL